MRKPVVSIILLLIVAGAIVFWEIGESSPTHTKTNDQAQRQGKVKSSIRRLPSFGLAKIKGHIPNVNAYWWVEFEEGSPSSEVRVLTKRSTVLKPGALRFVVAGKHVNLKLGLRAQLLEVTAFYNTRQEAADFYEEVRHSDSNSISLTRIITVNGKQHKLRLTQLAVRAFDPQFSHHGTHPGLVAA